jgi:pSer/pThr/pTyr-binding forkhead associated (FHA) protein
VKLGGIWNAFGFGASPAVGGPSSVPPAPAPPKPPVEPALPTDQVLLLDYSPRPNRFLDLGDGKKVALPEQGRFTIGRDSEAQVRLPGDLVSRKHCQAEFRNGKLWLMDQSSNGTFVNGKPLARGEWVEVGSTAEIGFGDAGQKLKLGQNQTTQPTAPGWKGPDGLEWQWPPDQEMVKVGRADGNHLQMPHDLVSGNHAMMRRRDGKIEVLDLSRNGTFIDGERVLPQRWTPLPAGSTIAFGSAALSWSGEPLADRVPGKEEIRLPDGRLGLVEQLPDGRVHLGKVVRLLAVSDLDPGKVMRFGESSAEKIYRADQLKVGENIAWTEGNRFYNAEVLGHSGESVQVGRSQTFANRQEYETYLRNKQEAADRKLAAENQRQAERQAKAAQGRSHWLQQLAPLGFDENQIAGSARLLLQSGAPLGVDGVGLWSKELEGEVLSQKAAQLGQQPVPGKGTVESSGLLPLQLAQWKATQRGEFLLVRGIVGEYSDKSWGRFYTPELGAAMGYASKEDGQPSQILGLAIPTSDIPRFYRDVGSLPGRNPYAEVYDIAQGELGPERQPEVLLNSHQPQQAWTFAAFRQNSEIEDSERGRQDYQRLNLLLTGRS